MLSVFICQFCAQRPIFFWDKFVDFFLPVTNKPQGNRLHPAAAQPFFHLFPQKVADRIADEPIQHPARLLCVHQIHVDIPRLRNGTLDCCFCNLVKCNAADRLFLVQIQRVQQMPADGFPFAVRVSCKEYFVRIFRIPPQLAQKLAFAADGDIFGFKIILDVNTQLAFRQIADMPHGSLNFIAAPQKFADGRSFRGRFHDNQIFFPAFLCRGLFLFYTFCGSFCHIPPQN